MNPLFAAPGVPEMLLILAVVVLLFGAKKLPELARGSGRALRIFKSETKGLVDDDEMKTEAQREIEARQDSLETDTERIAREQRDGA
jgi:sec-independent protein translocase protein TatA